jgi:hypothetical protein
LQHSELFWALRGGGGNFGIVTEYEFRLAPVGSIVGGALVLPATREIVRAYLEYAEQAPDELSTITHIMHAPPAPFIPEERVGDLVMMILVSWCGEEAEGQRVVDGLRALAEPIADTVGPIPYPVIYVYMEEAAKPHSAVVRSLFSNNLSDETIDALIEQTRVAPSPMAMVQLRVLGGAMARVDPGETAFANRDKRYMVTVLGLWIEPDMDGPATKAWSLKLWDAIKHEATGVYSNFLDREGEQRIRQAYPGQAYERLAEVKRQYDPENVFRLNQNIKPAA